MTSSGNDLEVAAHIAIMAASHINGFRGVKGWTFLEELLKESTPLKNATRSLVGKIPKQLKLLMNNITIPYLGPDGHEWPESLLTVPGVRAASYYRLPDLSQKDAAFKIFLEASEVEEKKAVLESKNLDIVDATILLPILQRSFDDEDERNARKLKGKKVESDGDVGDKIGDAHEVDHVGDMDGVGDGDDDDDMEGVGHEMEDVGDKDGVGHGDDGDATEGTEVAGEAIVSVEVEKPWLHITACYDATTLASKSKLARYVKMKKLNLYIVKETKEANKFNVTCPFGEFEALNGICIVLALKIDKLRAKTIN
jgi:hypothetical protein